MHPHAWEFHDYPVILGRLFGGDGFRGQGARLSWQLPLCSKCPVTVLAGFQNARGSTQASFLGVHPPELTDIDQLLKEGDVLRWGSFEAQVIHTPGHTPGSVSLYLPHDAGKVTGASTIHTVLDEAGEKIALTDLLKKAAGPEGAAEDLPPDEPERMAGHAPQLFSGDTLFAGSIGRTDLWGGSMEQILDSLRTKLMHLPDDTVVYPGHGPVTTIGNERYLNPFLQPE